MMELWMSVMPRAVCACLTAFVISVGLTPMAIRFLQRLQMKQVVREEGPMAHYSKRGTPTMGGVIILIAIVISTLVWASLNNASVWLVLLVLVGYGAIGWVDDFLKIVRKNTKGLRGKYKLCWQTVIALVIVIYWYMTSPANTSHFLWIPWWHVSVYWGLAFIIISFFVIVGTSNAVNLTDGLDGLAIVPVMLVAIALGGLAYVSSHETFALYFHLLHIDGAGELTVVCATILGAGLGFWWFNAYPARVFMGDVGALALGGALGVMAVILRQEILLFIMGGLFVVEAVSVMLQVGSFKCRKKRIFKMAPIHHHFELLGWPEPRVVARFWIVTILLVLLGLTTLVF